MNSHTLKIIGSCELPKPLEMGLDYTLGARISIVSIEKLDNQDGSYTYSHKGKISLVEVADKAGKTIKGISKGSNSQKWRNSVGAIKGFEEYDRIMTKMLLNADTVIEFIEKL